MPDPVAELVERGRALPPEDRERLVDQLLESLNEPAAAELPRHRQLLYDGESIGSSSPRHSCRSIE